MVAQHGFERAKYIVDFAQLAAAKTGYFPQTFGGILQYTSQALTAYEDFLVKSEAANRARDEAKARHEFETLHAELAERQRRDAEERLASLPPNEYEALHTKVTTDLRRSSWHPRDESSAFFQKSVRGAMIMELMRQAGEPEPPQTRLS
jgi:RNA 3'-terminal phosphate cyclase